jgi:hypothetical protein
MPGIKNYPTERFKNRFFIKDTKMLLFKFIFYVLRNFDWWWKRVKIVTIRSGKTNRENYSEKKNNYWKSNKEKQKILCVKKAKKFREFYSVKVNFSGVYLISEFL